MGTNCWHGVNAPRQVRIFWCTHGAATAALAAIMSRLDAFLAHQGVGSRSECKKLIRAKRVRINDTVVTHAQTLVAADDRVTVDHQPVTVRISEATLLLHKPIGYACSHDLREAPLIDDLIPETYRHLALNSAGRLDRATSGLLILSTDGQLLHRLSHPKRGVWKRYRLTYSGQLMAQAENVVREGLNLKDEPERPCRPACLIREPNKETGREQEQTATMWLHEGRFHQVRRMIAALGGEVVTLHRDQFGGLALPADLAAGAIRPLTNEELSLIHQDCQPPGWS